MEAVPESLEEIELVPMEGKLGPHVFEYKKGQYLFVELPEGWDIRFHKTVRRDDHKKRHFLMEFLEYITKHVKKKMLLKRIMDQFHQEVFVQQWKQRKCKRCDIERYNEKRFQKEGMIELIDEFGQIDIEEKNAFECVKKYWQEWQPLFRQTQKNRSMILQAFHKLIKKHKKSIEIIILTGDKELYQRKIRDIRKHFENDLLSKIKFLTMKGMKWDSLIYTYMQCRIYQSETMTDKQAEHVILYYFLQILYICYGNSLTNEENDTLFIYMKNGKTREKKIDGIYHDTHPLLRGLWAKERK